MPVGCVLVSAVGSVSGHALVSTLRRRWGGDLTIVGIDTEPPFLVAGSAMLDDYRQVAPPRSEDFDDDLASAMEATAPDLVIPLREERVLLLAQMRDLGEVRIAVGDPAVVEQVHDKLALADLVESVSEHPYDLLCPPTVPLERARWHRHGLFAKPRFGLSGGAGVAIERREDVDTLLQRVGGTPYIAQPRCRQPEITIDVFRSRDGELFRAVCRERLAGRGDDCTAARVHDDDELSDLCHDLFSRLGLSGLFCAQVMRGPADQWCLTDLKLRPGSGAPLSVAAGVDVYSLLVADQLGLEVDPAWAPPIDSPRYVVRTFDEHVLPGPED